MRKRVLSAILTAVVGIVCFSIPVFAFLYRAPITIIESSSTAHTQLPVKAASNNKYLASNGFISSSARDTAVGTLASTSYPHMVSDSYVWTVTDIPALGQVNLYYYTGETPADFDIIVGVGGSFKTKDVAALELGNNFEINVSGGLKAYVGANENIMFKDNAIKLWQSAATTISVAIYNGGGWVTTVASAAGVTPGAHVFTITADVQNMKLYVDAVLADTETLANGTISVPDSANDIIWNQNNVMSYIDYITVEVD